MDRDAQHEDAQIAGHERQLIQAALKAERPGSCDRRPRDECPEQSDATPGKAAQPPDREKPQDCGDEHNPPDNDSDLAVHYEVIAAPVDREIEPDRGGEQPGAEGVAIDSAKQASPRGLETYRYRCHVSARSPAAQNRNPAGREQDDDQNHWQQWSETSARRRSPERFQKVRGRGCLARRRDRG